jgi:hypothetical protein
MSCPSSFRKNTWLTTYARIGNPTAKRVKRTEADDAATTRPESRDGKAAPPAPTAPTPARKITSQTALPRLASRLMTPTRSSIARSQSVKTTKSSSLIPSLLKAPSTKNLFSPVTVAQNMRDGARESMRKVGDYTATIIPKDCTDYNSRQVRIYSVSAQYSVRPIANSRRTLHRLLQALTCPLLQP